MRNYFSTVLLILVLVALVGDIAIRSRTVHAQSSPTVYIDKVFANSLLKPFAIKGTEVVSFSCSGDSCYVLSK